MAAASGASSKSGTPRPSRPARLWMSLFRRYKKTRGGKQPAVEAEPAAPAAAPAKMVVPRCVIERVGTLELDEEEEAALVRRLSSGLRLSADDLGDAADLAGDGDDEDEVCCLNSQRDSLKTSKGERRRTVHSFRK